MASAFPHQHFQSRGNLLLVAITVYSTLGKLRVLALYQALNPHSLSHIITVSSCTGGKTRHKTGKQRAVAELVLNPAAWLVPTHTKLQLNHRNITVHSATGKDRSWPGCPPLRLGKKISAGTVCL